MNSHCFVSIKLSLLQEDHVKWGRISHKIMYQFGTILKQSKLFFLVINYVYSYKASDVYQLKLLHISTFAEWRSSTCLCKCPKSKYDALILFVLIWNLTKRNHNSLGLDHERMFSKYRVSLFLQHPTCSAENSNKSRWDNKSRLSNYENVDCVHMITTSKEF